MAPIAANYAEGMRKEAPEPTRGSGKAKSPSSKAQVAVAELTEDEKHQRKNLGLILVCWSIVVPALLDTFVLWDAIWKRFMPRFMEFTPYVLTVFVGVPLALLFYNTHVKQKK